MKSFRLTVMTPEKLFFEGECSSLIFPSPDGEVGIMSGRAPLVSLTVPGALRFRVSGEHEMRLAAITSGILRASTGSVLLLTDSAEYADEIDEERAERDIESSEMHIRNRATLKEYRLAKLGLLRATSRLKVKRLNK